MSEHSFRPSKLSLKVKFIGFSTIVVVLIAVTGLMFYNRTSIAMQKDLTGRIHSAAQNLARNPNLKLGLMHEDQNQINSLIGPAAAQRGVLYVVVRSADDKFSIVGQNKNSQPFLDYYNRGLTDHRAVPVALR